MQKLQKFPMKLLLSRLYTIKKTLCFLKLQVLQKQNLENSRKPFRAIVFLGFYFFSFAFSKKQSY